MFGKIISLIAMQHSASANSALFQRLLRGVGIVVFLAFTSAFLASIFLAGLVVMGYKLLVENGFTENVAMVMTGLWLTVVFLVLLFCMKQRCRELKAISQQVVCNPSPLSEKLSKVLYAFFDGIRGKDRI